MENLYQKLWVVEIHLNNEWSPFCIYADMERAMKAVNDIEKKSFTARTIEFNRGEKLQTHH